MSIRRSALCTRRWASTSVLWTSSSTCCTKTSWTRRSTWSRSPRPLNTIRYTQTRMIISAKCNEAEIWHEEDILHSGPLINVNTSSSAPVQYPPGRSGRGVHHAAGWSHQSEYQHQHQDKGPTSYFEIKLKRPVKQLVLWQCIWSLNSCGSCRCPCAVYPECLGLHGGGGRSPAGVPARRSGEGRPRRAAEGPGDVLQRHPTVLQEDPPQDARNRRAGNTSGTQLRTAGIHGNRTPQLGQLLLFLLLYH